MPSAPAGFISVRKRAPELTPELPPRPMAGTINVYTPPDAAEPDFLVIHGAPGVLCDRLEPSTSPSAGEAWPWRPAQPTNGSVEQNHSCFRAGRGVAPSRAPFRGDPYRLGTGAVRRSTRRIAAGRFVVQPSLRPARTCSTRAAPAPRSAWPDKRATTTPDPYGRLTFLSPMVKTPHCSSFTADRPTLAAEPRLSR